MSLLKSYVSRRQNNDRLRKILKSVAEETSITWPGTSAAGFDMLVLSLRSQAKTDLGDIYAFLDNCCQRVSKKAVIYAEQLRALMKSLPNDSVVEASPRLPDLLMVTFMEQLPHLIARQSEGPISAVTRFLRHFVEVCALRDVQSTVLVLVRNNLANSFTPEDPCRQIMEKALQEPLNTGTLAAFTLLQQIYKDFHQPPVSAQRSDKEVQLEALVPHGPPAEDDDHRGLTRWTREDILDAITDGAIEELFLCLCSTHEEIRKQALAGINAFNGRLEVSLLSVIAYIANAV